MGVYLCGIEMEEDVDYRLAASCYEGRKMSRSVTNQGDVVVPRPTLGGAGGVIQVMDGAGDTGKKSRGDRNGKSDKELTLWERERISQISFPAVPNSLKYDG